VLTHFSTPVDVSHIQVPARQYPDHTARRAELVHGAGKGVPLTYVTCISRGCRIGNSNRTGAGIGRGVCPKVNSRVRASALIAGGAVVTKNVGAKNPIGVIGFINVLVVA